jgi:ABC-type sugar transport system substrate-binding protein
VKFVLLVPRIGAGGAFYDVIASVMRAAAGRLGVELEVVDAEARREDMVEAARGITTRRPRPDCVIFPNQKGAAHDILPALDAAGIPSFVFVEGLTPTDLIGRGQPRTKLPRWLGQLQPDDVAAGHLLARLLVDQARERGMAAPDGKIHVGIIAGDQTPAGQLRFQGWLALKRERPEVTQASVQYANWQEESGREAAVQLVRNHPEVSVIWAANDDMALGAVDAIRAAGREPGRDVLVGGVDLLPRALQQVADGRMAVTLGGHFLDGARALILVHDHLGGRDFEPWVRRSTLEPVTVDHARRYLRFFEERAWERVDYERYSRVRVGSDEVPELSLATLLPRPRPPGR